MSSRRRESSLKPATSFAPSGFVNIADAIDETGRAHFKEDWSNRSHILSGSWSDREEKEAIYSEALMQLQRQLETGLRNAVYLRGNGEIVGLPNRVWRGEDAQWALWNGCWPNHERRRTKSAARSMAFPLFVRETVIEARYEDGSEGKEIGKVEPISPKQVTFGGTGTATSYRTGAPGRPTSTALVTGELKRRFARGEVESSLRQQAEALSRWLSISHPEAPQMEPKTVENQVRALWRSLDPEKKRIE